MVDIKGFEGLYAITEDGRVWGHKRKKFLKPQLLGAYLGVRLYINGKGKDYLIHRLVAEAYIPNPDGKPQVNHIDEDKYNNNINNLEWVTIKENSNHGTRNERIANKTGKANSKPVYCIELDRVFEGATAAARELNLQQSGISYCCQGKRNTCGGYHWRYA